VLHGELRAVPVLIASAQLAPNHVVTQAELSNGRVLRISPNHPTADGRTFGQLRSGDQISGLQLRRVVFVPYGHERTYDILPASDTATYFAAGVLIGSTLASSAPPIEACMTAPKQ